MQNEGDTPQARKTIRDYKSAKRRTVEATWPGTERPLTLLYLHCDEQQAAYFAARDYFDRKNQALDRVGETQFQLELEYQLVYRMALQPEARDPAARLFADVAEVRATLTPNESDTIVHQHWLEQQREGAEWTSRPGDPFIRQLARELDVDEKTHPDEMLALVGRLRATARIIASVSEGTDG